MGTSEHDGDLSPMGQAAVSLHELFLGFVDAGFTENQAIRMIAIMATETMQNGEEGEG